MNTEQILRVVQREIAALGHAYRASWAGFDGRTLRDELETIAQWADNPTCRLTEGSEKFIKQEGYPDIIEKWVKTAPYSEAELGFLWAVMHETNADEDVNDWSADWATLFNWCEEQQPPAAAAGEADHASG